MSPCTNGDLKFRDNFLNKNEEGGREAADELLVQVHKYVGELGLDVNKTDVVVRAYANLRGLSKFCARDGLMNATADVGLFANGFTKRQPLFDFVDVGLGKERADNKVRGRQCTLLPSRLVLRAELWYTYRDAQLLPQ